MGKIKQIKCCTIQRAHTDNKTKANYLTSTSFDYRYSVNDDTVLLVLRETKYNVTSATGKNGSGLFFRITVIKDITKQSLTVDENPRAGLAPVARCASTADRS
jgi:hypothetical protein